MRLGHSAKRGAAQLNNLDALNNGLDLTRNPYSACPAAIEARDAPLESPSEPLAETLINHLARIYRVPAGSLRLFGSVDVTIRDFARHHPGPTVVFPPAHAAALPTESCTGFDPISIARGVCSDTVVGSDCASDIPVDALAIIDSPSNPLGSIVSPADLVRLSRACASVVIDERFAEFSEFSLLPLALELENVIIMRSFAPWAGLPEIACSWALTPPGLVGDQVLATSPVHPAAIAGAIATLESHASVAGTLRLVREERSRLFRFLRRLSFIEPLPSHGPFITGRVAVVSRRDVVEGLARRGARIHAPGEPGLEDYVRIGIGARITMDRLRAALLELGSELIA